MAESIQAERPTFDFAELERRELELVVTATTELVTTLHLSVRAEALKGQREALAKAVRELAEAMGAEVPSILKWEPR